MFLYLDKCQIGDTGKIALDKGNNKNPFEAKALDKFVVEAQDVGFITKIKIGHGKN